MAKSVAILDCTLRDGSYVVRQQFTAADTARICAALEAGGIRQIEIGHGFGLGASSSRLGIAAATDEEYVAAAAQTLRQAHFGAFYIPGIGTTDHLDMARAVARITAAWPLAFHAHGGAAHGPRAEQVAGPAGRLLCTFAH